jgi:hypothetical protein
MLDRLADVLAAAAVETAALAALDLLLVVTPAESDTLWDILGAGVEVFG